MADVGCGIRLDHTLWCWGQPDASGTLDPNPTEIGAATTWADVSAGTGPIAAGTTGGAARSSGTGGGAHWVLCPPGGSSGLLPLFAGTDLSCTPD